MKKFNNYMKNLQVLKKAENEDLDNEFIYGENLELIKIRENTNVCIFPYFLINYIFLASIQSAIHRQASVVLP